MKARASVTVVAVVATLGGAAQACGGDAARRIIGAWRLVSTEQRMSDGTTRPSPLYGPNGVGYLMYSESGRVCAVLTDPGRALWKSEETPTDVELRDAFEHFVAYCGHYEVNEQERSIVHHVEMSAVPNSAGAHLKRYFSLEGNRLTLRPAEQVGTGVVEYTLTWERVASSAEP